MPRTFTEKIFTNISRLDRREIVSYLRSAREQVELQTTILDTMNEAVIALDKSLTVMFANASVHDLLGIEKDAIEDMPLEECLRDSALKQAVQNAGTDAYVTLDVAVMYPRSLTLQLHVIPLGTTREADSNNVNPTPSLLILFRDITREQHRRTETERESRLETLRLLTAGIAHEIGNPLSAIILHAQLMQRSVAELPQSETSDKCADITRVIYDESQRLKRIVGDFLNAVRPLSLSLHPGNICTVLEDILELLQSELDMNNINVEKHFTSLPDILIDEDQLRSVFINVIRNAVDAMDSGGSLSISTHEKGNTVTVVFTDTGTGMTPEELSRVFAPYYTTKADGSGLGMLITQRIMNAHGGTVKLDSTPGKGTTVYLTFPRHYSTERHSLPPPSDISSHNSST